MPSMLEQYRVSDFLGWDREKSLKVNPDFQRGSIWKPAARSYLIDTILRQHPIPKIYLRTKIDVETKRSFREIVDGQQRIKAIVDFANNHFALSKNADEFAGLRYSNLDSAYQELFLSYAISVDQLINATDDDVIEVFSRLNASSVQLNPAELRHVQYQGDFKWAVYESSRRWSVLWDQYDIISVWLRVRKQDDSLMAELFGLLLEGVTDGDQSNITKLYRKYDNESSSQMKIVPMVDRTLELFVGQFANYLKGTSVLRPPHFLMLFGALAHALHGLPEGAMGIDLPGRDSNVLKDFDAARNNLLELATIIDSDDARPGFEAFWKASKSSTQRISGRRIRFPVFYRALLPSTL